MSLLVVGIGDCLVSRTPGTILVTYALGSCIGISIHDPVMQVGGLLHILLPDSALDPIKAKSRPFAFADTAIPCLFDQAYTLGARKERLCVQIAGGSQMSLTGGVLNVGPKNIHAVRRILSQFGIRIQKEDLGGNWARTVRLNVGTGEFQIERSAANYKKALLSPAGQTQNNPAYSQLMPSVFVMSAQQRTNFAD